jgi:DNA-binding NtrC family response regulator
VFTISVPPLRDLGEDKRTLLDHFREFYARQAACQPFEFDKRAMQTWLEYGFPGNVRELRNIVIRLTTKHAGQTVGAEQLQAELDLESVDVALPGLAPAQDFKTLLEAAKKHLQLQKNFNLDMTLQQWERGYVEAALAITHGNLSQAARLLGIHRTTLYSRIQNYGTQEGAADK